MLFKDEYGFLSNMYPATVTMVADEEFKKKYPNVVFDNTIYPTSEHAYMAMKSDDPKWREFILSEENPRKVKKASRDIKLRSDWDSIKREIMEAVVCLKFTQHQELLDKLRKIDGRIVEDNFWNDTYFGVCRGVGYNHLGRILMVLRGDVFPERNLLEEARVPLQTIDSVVVNTDYDADGISSSVVGMKVLKSMNKKIHHILLNNEHPRGVSDETINRTIAITDKFERFVFLTADHGSSDAERFNRLRNDRPNVVIVMTDHHLVDNESALENAVDHIINPHYSKCNLNKAFSGCNVLFRLLAPFITKELRKELLPIVAMANIIDQMSMADEENRKTYYEAMEYIKESELFNKLLKVTYKKRMHDRWLSMNVGPLINSTHRLAKPNIAFEFLMGDISKISEMSFMNKDRKNQTNSLYSVLLKQLTANAKLFKNVMVLLNPMDTTSFNGLVAGRIGNEINTPTFVLTRVGNTFKGSARAIQKIPLIDILQYINDNSDSILHYGGHHAACGVSINGTSDAIKDFVKYFEKYIEDNNIGYTDEEETIKIDPREIQKEVVTIEKNRPYGQGNPYPIYESTFTIHKVKSYGKITKLWFEETDSEMIYFKSFGHNPGEKVSFSYTIEIDDKVQLMAVKHLN